MMAQNERGVFRRVTGGTHNEYGAQVLGRAVPSSVKVSRAAGVTETDDAWGRSGRRGIAPIPSYPAANASRGMHDRPRVSILAPVAATLEQRKPRGGIAMEQAIVRASSPKSAAPRTANRSLVRRLHPPLHAMFQGKDRT